MTFNKSRVIYFKDSSQVIHSELTTLTNNGKSDNLIVYGIIEVTDSLGVATPSNKLYLVEID